MRTQILIAAADCGYAEHLSNTMVENHADAIDVSVVSAPESMRELLGIRKFDVALLDAIMLDNADLKSIQLPLLLWSDNENIPYVTDELKKVRKYQRISSLVSQVLELYAKGQASERGPDSKRASVTAVWSPSGGVGKTTTALAYCAGKVSQGTQALYLDLETFSSVQAYFADNGRSISSIFEMLETGEGNIKMLVRSIRQKDGNSEIAYFCRPENYDDMNILSVENISELIEACCEMTDELVIDMSSQCDERTRKVFELADRVLLVTDSTNTAQIKFSQFASQHDVFQRIKGKAALVANKGGSVGATLVEEVVYLPFIQSVDAETVYKTLAAVNFDV